MQQTFLSLTIVGLAVAAVFLMPPAFRSKGATHPAWGQAAWAVFTLFIAVCCVMAWYKVVREEDYPELLDLAHTVLSPLNALATFFLVHRAGRMLGRTERNPL